MDVTAFESEILGGDAETTTLVTSALSELLKSGGQAGAKYQADKEAKAKAEQQKKLSDAAVQAANEAAQADMAAANEANPNGPLHQQALVKRQAAQKAAQLAGMAFGGTGLVPAGTKSDGGGSFMTRVKGGVPVWGWVIGGVAIGGATLALIIRAMRRKK